MVYKNIDESTIKEITIGYTMLMLADTYAVDEEQAHYLECMYETLFTYHPEEARNQYQSQTFGFDVFVE